MSERARQELLAAARQRQQARGRQGLRRVPPRPRRPEQQIRSYRAALRRVMKAIEDETRAQVFPRIDELLESAGTRADDARLDDWGQRLRDLFASVRSSIMPTIGRTREIMLSLGDETTERATREQVRATRTVLGVAPTFYNDDKIRGILNAWKTQNEAFITRMADDAVQQIMDAASRAVRQGRPTKEIRGILRKRFGMNENRARTVARAEISQLNTQITRERQREVGINTYTWLASNDERVRDEHEQLDGDTVSWDDPPSLADNQHAGEPINCFPSGAILNGSPFIHKVYRHWYAGELTSITRDDGVILTATPNHPVLTADGFKPIKLINKGEHVFGAINERFGVINDNREHLVTEFSELFRAFILSGVGHSVSSGSRSQFHGDGANSEVDIVDVNSFLVSKGASDVVEKLLKLGLTYPDVALTRCFLSGYSPGDTNIFSVKSPSSCSMRIRDLIAPLLIRHLTPLECFRLALCSDMDAVNLQVPADNVSRDAKMLGDCIFACAVLVHGANAIRAQVNSVWGGSTSLVGRGVYPSLPETFTDNAAGNAEHLTNLFDGSPIAVKPFRVVNNFTADFAGHVYNLETEQGYFIADLHTVSNCRCVPRANVASLLNELEND